MRLAPWRFEFRGFGMWDPDFGVLDSGFRIRVSELLERLGVGGTFRVSVSGSGLHVSGSRIRDPGIRFLVSEFGFLGPGFGWWVSSLGFRVDRRSASPREKHSKFQISGLGIRDPGFGTRDSGSGCQNLQPRLARCVPALGFWVPGFRVSTFGFQNSV